MLNIRVPLRQEDALKKAMDTACEWSGPQSSSIILLHLTCHVSMGDLLHFRFIFDRLIIANNNEYTIILYYIVIIPIAL